ncbi:MAG: Ku-like_protein, partial [uncultured Friedmanniella sp.]
ATFDLEGSHLLRARDDPGQALLRDRGEGHQLPPGARRGRGPDQVQAGLRARRERGALRRHRQGLRDGRRADGGPGQGRHGPAAAGHHQVGRGGPVRRRGRGRPHLLQQDLLPAGRRARGQAIRAAPRRPEPERTVRRGQGGAPLPGGAGPDPPQGRGAGDAHHAVARRAAGRHLRRPAGQRHRLRRGGGDGPVLHRRPVRGLRARGLHRLLPGGRGGSGAEQGRRGAGRRADRGAPGGRGGRPGGRAAGVGGRGEEAAGGRRPGQDRL